MSDQLPIIKVENLSIAFGEQAAVLHEMNLQIAAGETVSLVGESGSGKSLTALAIMGLLPPTAKVQSGGHIWWQPTDNPAIDLLTKSDKAMQSIRGNQIGMVFQEPMSALNPVYRCGHQISEALEIHKGLSRKQAKPQVLDLIKQVQLPDPERIYRAYPHELSGGQKQRILIAMAISCQPRLLIADEPTTALDVTVQKEILALLRMLKETTDMAMLFISHDLGVVSEVADRVLVMRQGEVVERQPTQALMQHPQHPYTRGLLACRPPVDRDLRRLPVVADFEDQSIQVLDRLEELTITDEEKEDRREELEEALPVLAADNLSVSFSLKKNLWGKTTLSLKAVDGVSLTVLQGEILGLVGESGCGKSTLGRAILQLIESQSGQVWYKGENLHDLSSRQMRAMRRHIQIIFQDPYASLNPRLRVGEAIMEPMRVHGIYATKAERKAQTLKLLDSVGLEEAHFSRYPHQFSGGQRQRVCIARALAVKPSFLICDESVSALDVSVQAQVLNLLLDLQARYDFGCIFISHDLSVIRFISDRIAVMHQGKIVETGIPSKIFNSPETEYTRELIAAIPGGGV